MRAFTLKITAAPLGQPGSATGLLPSPPMIKANAGGLATVSHAPHRNNELNIRSCMIFRIFVHLSVGMLTRFLEINKILDWNDVSDPPIELSHHDLQLDLG